MIRTWVRRMLKEWEVDIDDIPEEVKRSVQGRNENNTYKQTKNYIKPLLQGLKQRSLEKSVLVVFKFKLMYSLYSILLVLLIPLRT
jgi:hypothetical protein